MAEGRLYLLLRMFRVAMSPRSAVVAPDKPRGPKRFLTNTGTNFRPILSCSALCGHNCLRNDFTLSAKLMSVAISWTNKMKQLSKIHSHI